MSPADSNTKPAVVREQLSCAQAHIEAPLRPNAPFTTREKLGILRRALRRWGWRGVKGALVREREIHRLLTREKVLGLTMIKGTRWSPEMTQDWTPVRVELVCEVAYDHLQGDRFRHATTFLRWRPDKPPPECRYDQLEETPPAELRQIFGA